MTLSFAKDADTASRAFGPDSESGSLAREDSCGFARSVQFGRRDAVYAANPSRHMALVGKARVGSDLRQTHAAPDAIDGRLQAQVYDVAMGRHAYRAGKDSCEVERASSR